MRALTIWQPWCSLIIDGFKPYEFRSRKCPRALIGQRIAQQKALIATLSDRARIEIDGTESR